MSFDIFLERYRDGQPAPFARAHAERIFGPRLIAPDAVHPWTRLRYPDVGADIELDVADAKQITGLIVRRPAGNMLFDDLFRLMREVGAILFWPDIDPCSAVTDASLIAHLPPDMLTTIGPPAVVASGADILRAIEGS